MEKKVLIAVDDSRCSENALRYAAGLIDSVHPLKLVLYHVQPTISQYLVDEAKTIPSANAELKRLMKRSQKSATALLERHACLLISCGVPDDSIQTLSLPRNIGVAKDILEYGTALTFDAIIVGRRGVSGLTEVFLGSVSNNIINHSEVIPVWVVDEKAPSRSIMVAVDGSQSSLRAVDHLAFIFGGNSDVTISFFHVTPRLSDVCPVDFADTDTSTLEEIIQAGDNAIIDRFYAHALKKLTDAGIGEGQIRTDIKKGGFKVGKAVVDAYRKGGFGTLIIGRRGTDRRYFSGSVSRYLVSQFSGGALWVVP